VRDVDPLFFFLDVEARRRRRLLTAKLPSHERRDGGRRGGGGREQIRRRGDDDDKRCVPWWASLQDLTETVWRESERVGRPASLQFPLRTPETHSKPRNNVGTA
jgi:hypothetical protein